MNWNAGRHNGALAAGAWKVRFRLILPPAHPSYHTGILPASNKTVVVDCQPYAKCFRELTIVIIQRERTARSGRESLPFQFPAVSIVESLTCNPNRICSSRSSARQARAVPTEISGGLPWLGRGLTRRSRWLCKLMSSPSRIFLGAAIPAQKE